MPKFKLAIIVILLLNFNSLFSDTLKLIEEKLSKTKNKSEKLLMLLDMAEFYSTDSINISIDYAKRALEIAIEQNDDIVLEDIYMSLGYYYLLQSDYINSLENYQEALSISRKLKNKESIVEIYNNMGIVYRGLEDFTKATISYEAALKYAKGNDTDIEEFRSNIHNNLGLLYTQLGDYEQAISNYLISFDLRLKSKAIPKYKIAESYNNIASVYIRLDNTVLAEKYLTKCLDYIGNDTSKVSYLIYDNLALVSLSNHKYDKAIEYISRSVKHYKSINKPRYVSIAYNNIGEAYKGKGELNKALEYYHKALVINDSIDYKEGTAINLLNIGSIYFRMKQYDKALEYYDKVGAYLNDHTMNHVKLELYQKYADVYKATDDLNTTLDYKNMYIHLRDSLFNLKRNFNISQILMAYEDAENQKIVANYKAEQLVKEKEINRKNTLLVSSIIVSILLIIIVYFIIQRLRSKSKFERVLLEKNTKLTELKDELEIAYEKEKELNIVKTNFVSMVSHEYRTPLSIIQITTDLLDNIIKNDKLDLAPKFLKSIRVAIESMTEMLDQVLFVTRSQSNKITFKPIKIEFVEYLNFMIDHFSMLQGKNIKINYHVNKEVIWLYFDKLALDHIVTNLISNAVKYSNDDSIVYVVLEERDECIYFSVKDSGIGIPKSEQVHLFEPFHRFTNSSKTKGTGLGLFIVNESVKVGNAKLEVESDTNMGCEFRVFFPKIQE